MVFFTEKICKYKNVCPAAANAVWGDVTRIVHSKAEQLGLTLTVL